MSWMDPGQAGRANLLLRSSACSARRAPSVCCCSWCRPGRPVGLEVGGLGLAGFSAGVVVLQENENEITPVRPAQPGRQGSLAPAGAEMSWASRQRTKNAKLSLARQCREKVPICGAGTVPPSEQQQQQGKSRIPVADHCARGPRARTHARTSSSNPQAE